MKIDLSLIAQRLQAGAHRAAAYEVSASGADLIISKDGFGTGRSEAVPFAALFLSDKDLLGQALDRLEHGFPQAT